MNKKMDTQEAQKRSLLNLYHFYAVKVDAILFSENQSFLTTLGETG